MKYKKNIILICLGLLILAIGIPVLIHSNVGLDPLGCFIQSLAYLTTISYGTMLSLVNIIFLVFHYCKNRNLRFALIGFTMSVTMSIIINASDLVIDIIPNEFLYQRIILFVISFFIISFGIALIQLGKIQKMPFEGFQEAVSNIVDKDINIIRVYTEIVLLILAIGIFIVVKLFVNTTINVFNTLNVGSIIIMFFTGPTINLIYRGLNKESKKKSIEENKE